MDLDDSLSERVVTLLASRDMWLATAESCTGGLIGHCVTNISGSSGVYRGGVVAYSNAVKTSLLGVPEAVLAEHGAVSAPVAEAMAEGIKARLGADWSVAVTGIAGPGGGTVEKPVGLVYVSVSGPAGTQVIKCNFSGSRSSIKEQTAETALRELLEFMEA